MDATVRDLRTLFDVGMTGVLSDRQLLDRFVGQREGAVFEAIVQRHGPMVWGVCRRVLRDHHDAEDAFQATFLVLARKAASVMPRDRLGRWLYGVAYRTATKARTIRARRRVREAQVPKIPEPGVLRQGPPDELLSLLDEELSRLPEKYRIPIVLCELEGMSHREAAERLGWPIGTVSGRLSRARAMLARRLSRPGVLLSGGSLAVLLAQEAASASIPTDLIVATARAASLFTGGQAATAGMVSTEVAALTRKVLRAMLLNKLKIITAALLLGITLAVVGTGLAYRVNAAGDQAGRFDQENQVGPRQSQSHAIQPILPGNPQSTFGGGPDEPRYIRDGNLFFVIWPHGDKFSIYDATTNKASTIRLPGSKDSPLRVTPILSGSDFVSLMLDGPKITRLYIFSLKDWKWYPQDLKEPVAGTVAPSVGHSVAGFTQGRYIYAFSAGAKRWSILELPKEAPAQPELRGTTGVSLGFQPHSQPDRGHAQAGMLVTPESIVVEYDGHVHEFGGRTGEWKHIDFRAMVDAALKSSETDAAKDDTKATK